MNLDYDEQRQLEREFKCEEELKSIEFSPGARFQLDYTNRILRAEESKFAMYFRFSNLLSADLHVDEVTSSGRSTTSVLGRAALFGLVTGGAGAVVGAMTAKTVAKREIKKVLLVVRARGWGHELTHYLYSTGMFKGYRAEEAISVGERVRDRLHEAPAAPQPPGGIAGELSTLAQLHASGALTSAEFEAAKKRLLA